MTLELGFIGIVTSDLAASLQFYRDLGVTIPKVGVDQDHVDAQLANGVTLAWDTSELISKLDSSYVPPAGGHRIALAFNLGTPAAVDAKYAALTAAGHLGKVAPWNAFWGQRYATLSDPDGNSVDLFAPLATS
jgi:catechol 2,3-dioxygenase-like lactoylglutathione lyase family enzyme